MRIEILRTDMYTESSPGSHQPLTAFVPILCYTLLHLPETERAGILSAQQMEVEMPKTYCPNCDAIISMEGPREGASITCRECSTELEVISVSPFEVDYPLDYDEDWDDDLEEE